jgi:hypothetical protein
VTTGSGIIIANFHTKKDAEDFMKKARRKGWEDKFLTKEEFETKYNKKMKKVS